jgi:hypothetical protein
VRTDHASERSLVAARRRTRPGGVCFDTARGERILSASFTGVNEHQGLRILFALTQNA